MFSSENRESMPIEKCKMIDSFNESEYLVNMFAGNYLLIIFGILLMCHKACKYEGTPVTEDGLIEK